MAVPAGTFQTFDAKGVREDLQDVIYDISPMDTPFMSSIGKGKATNQYHEWQTDSLADATSLNAQIDGDDATGQTATPTVRYGNYCQLSWKVPQVSGGLRVAKTAGRADEMSLQIMKRSRELKRDIEKAISSDNAASAGSTSTARKLAGVGSWLWDNEIVVNTSATTVAITSGAPTTAGQAGTTTSAFVESRLKEALAAAWTDGGDPDLILVNSTNKQLASAFAGIATQYRDNSGKAGPATIIGAADVYVSDFGTHNIVASRWLPGTSALCLDTEYWSVNYFRPIQQEPLAKTGDSDKRLILAEYTLVAKAPSSSAKVNGITA